MGKFTNEERFKVKSIVATLTLKRISDKEIIEIIFNQTKKMILIERYMTGQSIKKDSYQWYKTVCEGQYEYIHEFKERIDEIISMQKKLHEILE